MKSTTFVKIDMLFENVIFPIMFIMSVIMNWPVIVKIIFGAFMAKLLFILAIVILKGIQLSIKHYGLYWWYALFVIYFYGYVIGFIKVLNNEDELLDVYFNYNPISGIKEIIRSDY